jgi:phosphoesterase RecJ-like protein
VTWSAPPAQSDWDDVVAALRQAPDVLLVAHVSPDADALGSALGVGLALRQLGRPVAVSFGDQPFTVPRTLRELPGLELLRDPSRVGAASVVVSFDVSSKERLGVLADVFDRAKLRVAVDHHTSYTGFGQVSLVDVSAPAAAVLALELVDRLGADLTAQVAAPLYAGLLTDTGRFTYAGTTARTHAVAARLLATGIAHDTIARTLYDDDSFPALVLLGTALGRAELEPAAVAGRGLVHTYVTREERARHALAMDSLERVIDVLRCAGEAEVAAVLKQDDDGAWRVSMRSRGAVDVSQVAVGLGGGGHRYAAGYTAPTDREDVLVALRAGLADVASPA